MPSPLDRINIGASPGLLQRHQSEWYIAGPAGEIDWLFTEPDDQKQEPPRADFLNSLLGDDMFGPITLPFGAKMLSNTVRLKPGVTFEDVELAVGELCSVVNGTYGADKGGFLAEQVFTAPVSCHTRDPSLNPEPPTTIMSS